MSTIIKPLSNIDKVLKPILNVFIIEIMDKLAGGIGTALEPIADIPGAGTIVDTIKKQLSKALGAITGPIIDETMNSLQNKHPELKEIVID